MIYDSWLKLSSHLHMPLRECISKHSHRELVLWMQWLHKEYDQPSRSDFYIMQLTAYVRAFMQGMSGSKAKIRLKDFLLEFNKKEIKLDNETINKLNKAKWFAITGLYSSQLLNE